MAIYTHLVDQTDNIYSLAVSMGKKSKPAHMSLLLWGPQGYQQDAFSTGVYSVFIRVKESIISSYTGREGSVWNHWSGRWIPIAHDTRLKDFKDRSPISTIWHQMSSSLAIEFRHRSLEAALRAHIMISLILSVYPTCLEFSYQQYFSFYTFLILSIWLLYLEKENILLIK